MFARTVGAGWARFGGREVHHRRHGADEEDAGRALYSTAARSDLILTDGFLVNVKYFHEKSIEFLENS